MDSNAHNINILCQYKVGSDLISYDGGRFEKVNFLSRMWREIKLLFVGREQAYADCHIVGLAERIQEVLFKGDLSLADRATLQGKLEDIKRLRSVTAFQIGEIDTHESRLNALRQLGGLMKIQACFTHYIAAKRGKEILIGLRTHQDLSLKVDTKASSVTTLGRINNWALDCVADGVIFSVIKWNDVSEESRGTLIYASEGAFFLVNYAVKNVILNKIPKEILTVSSHFAKAFVSDSGSNQQALSLAYGASELLTCTMKYIGTQFPAPEDLQHIEDRT